MHRPLAALTPINYYSTASPKRKRAYLLKVTLAYMVYVSQALSARRPGGVVNDFSTILRIAKSLASLCARLLRDNTCVVLCGTLTTAAARTLIAYA